MKLYKFLLCACLALPVMSCDDYLDIQPKGIVIPEKSEDYERLLNYAQLLKASESYPNFMTDDVFMPYEDDMTQKLLAIEHNSINVHSLHSFPELQSL
jgi:hypothetical protein